MRKTTLSIIALGTVFVPLMQAAPAHAQASRTWVSGVGDDVNPCSRTAPCKTFAGAISKTALNGEINCLDPGGFGTVTITKSITIDCHEIFAGVLNAGLNGINIPFDSFNTAGEVRFTVRLRNLNFNGFQTGTGGVRVTGGATHPGGAVFVEDCLIDGNFAGNARGISDERTGGGELYVSNTTIRNNGGTGIVVLPASGSTRIDAMLDNVRSQNNAAGVAINNGAKAMIFRSVFSGNTNTGIDVEGAGAEANVDESISSSNGTGVFTANGGVMRLSNTTVAFNKTNGAGGTINSYTNNRFFGNAGANVTTPIGGPSTPTGQQ
jgi:hypothetical protein